jgi:hypothetical protein
MLLPVLGNYRYAAGMSSSAITHISVSVNIVKFKTCKGQTHNNNNNNNNNNVGILLLLF